MKMIWNTLVSATEEQEDRVAVYHNTFDDTDRTLYLAKKRRVSGRR